MIVRLKVMNKDWSSFRKHRMKNQSDIENLSAYDEINLISDEIE